MRRGPTPDGRAKEPTDCRSCRLFVDQPDELERALPGLTILSSAAFLDLTLKGKKEAIRDLRTRRYQTLTTDGRGVTVEARSLWRTGHGGRVQ
jgi:hypothetical protein